MALIDTLGEVPDPRRGNAQRHERLDILAIALVASICGAESCVDFAEFAEDREPLLREFLSLRNGLPSHDTFSRVFRLLDPAAFARTFEVFLDDLTIAPVPPEVLAAFNDPGRDAPAREDAEPEPMADHPQGQAGAPGAGAARGARARGATQTRGCGWRWPAGGAPRRRTPRRRSSACGRRTSACATRATPRRAPRPTTSSTAR